MLFVLKGYGKSSVPEDDGERERFAEPAFGVGVCST